MTTKTILGTTEYGVPSGNYDGSSQDWSSDPVTAANYYRGRGGLQTVLISVTGFEGLIYIDGTLDTVPSSVDTKWFNTYVYGDGSTIPLTDYHPANIIGNFTWIRLRIEGFSGGRINAVTISY
jgi:hypothetical protein